MIKTWLCTGDTHGTLKRFYPSAFTVEDPKTTGIIILGDAGFNYYLNHRDIELKRAAARMSFTFYLVRGNHEARPQDIEGMELIYDENVRGNVYCEPEYPNIRYFLDGGFYNIDGKNVLVIGGAYSVDKMWRLTKGWSWFENEQLNDDERVHITDCIKDYLADGNHLDLVLTHTAPIGFEPTQMFLDCIDQDYVDKSTETWLQAIYDLIPKDCFFLFGHYHGDLIMGDNIAMLYERIIDLSCIDTFDSPSIEPPKGFEFAHPYQYDRESRGLPLF